MNIIQVDIYEPFEKYMLNIKQLSSARKYTRTIAKWSEDLVNNGVISKEIGAIYDIDEYKNCVKQIKESDVYSDFKSERKSKNPNSGLEIDAALSNYEEFLNYMEKMGIIERGDDKMEIQQIENYINAKGYIYAYDDLSNFYLSLKTKPFVILAGTSGTGKSKLVKLFAEAVGATIATNQYHLISVKPDWNDSTELLGYKNIREDFIPGKLTLIIEEALNNPQKPYFVCLDEMNLARVEYYLSEYLSIIESREMNTQEKNAITTGRIFPNNYLLQKDKKYDISIPDNLYLIGTVNMDDTTFSFSRKVLDRANTIEFGNANLENLNFMEEETMPLIQKNEWLRSSYLTIKDALRINEALVKSTNKKIIQLNQILEQGNKCFGYRVRDEIVFYMLENHEKQLLDENIAFDFQVMQKILPILTGSESVLKSILIDFFNYCVPSAKIVDRLGYIESAKLSLETALYPRSARKILMMLRGYEDGFTSFWG